MADFVQVTLMLPQSGGPIEYQQAISLAAALSTDARAQFALSNLLAHINSQAIFMTQAVAPIFTPAQEPFDER